MTERQYLNQKYNIRLNTIALELEIQLEENNKNWSVLRINSLLIEFAQSGNFDNQSFDKALQSYL